MSRAEDPTMPWVRRVNQFLLRVAFNCYPWTHRKLSDKVVVGFVVDRSEATMLRMEFEDIGVCGGMGILVYKGGDAGDPGVGE